MARALKTIAIVAGVVALAASVVVTGGATLGLAQSVIAVAGTVGAIAAVVGIAASLGAAALQKKPPAQGSTSSIYIGANLPTPYTMGRTYIGGNLLHDVGYGGTVKDVPNPYRAMVFEYSGAGPVHEFEAFQADFTTVSLSGGSALGYYSGFLSVDTQLGATPEGSALTGPYGAIPGWGGSYKMSGHAAALASLKFDKKGKVYASGVPQFGAILKGVLAYDPRLDSTYPGGSGTQRWADETTWAYSDNPALHTLSYARGRYQAGKKVMGCGFEQSAVDIATFVAWANVCDANGWVLGGTIYEPGSRWDNLKRMCAAGAAVPVFVGARLSVQYDAPKVALDTITPDDLADGEYRVPAMKSWRDRVNGIIPKYRSEAHKWEYVQSDLVSVSTYVTEDGEEKNEELQFDLVQNMDQAAKLAAYDLVDRREFGPIVLPCKPRMIEYIPGEALEVDLPELGLVNQLCIIIGREVDPATATVTLTLQSETTGKHAFALGQTGTAPPTPTITSGEDMDAVIPKIPDVLPGQLLRDDTFSSRWWNVPTPAGRVEWDDSRTGFAVTVPFVASTNFRVVASSETSLLPRSTEGKALYVRAIADPSGFSGVQIVDDDDQPIIDSDGVYVVDASESDFSLEMSIRWLNADGSFHSRTVVATADPTGGLQTLTGNALAPVTGFGVIEFGYPSQTGKDGAWTVYEPWEAEYEPTADITAQAQVVVELTALRTYEADYLGVIGTGLPDTISPKVTRGGASIKTDDDVSYAITPSSGVTATIDNTTASAAKGDITITAMGGQDAWIDMAVTVGGVAQPAVRSSLRKNLGSPPASGGSSSKTASTGSFTPITSTSFTRIALLGTVTVASGESLYGSASLDYLIDGSAGTRRGTVKLRYAPTGTTSWTDIGVSAQGSFASGYTSPSGYYEPANPGHVDYAQTSTPSPGTYDVEIVALQSNTGRTMSFAGVAGVQAKV